MKKWVCTVCGWVYDEAVGDLRAWRLTICPTILSARSVVWTSRCLSSRNDTDLSECSPAHAGLFSVKRQVRLKYFCFSPKNPV